MILLLILVTYSNAVVEAKKKKTTTVTIPTEQYENDLVLEELFKPLIIRTKTKGKNTIITCDSKKVQKYIKDFKKEFSDFVKEQKKNKLFTDMKLSKDFKELSIYGLDKDANQNDSMQLFNFFLKIPAIQLLNGVKYADLDIYVKLYTEDGTLIKEGSIKDMSTSMSK